MVVDLYAIINEGQPMEMYVRDGKSRKDMESLLNHILKKIQNLSSKIIRTMTIHTYSIYYFGQASFIFILATESKDVHRLVFSAPPACRTISALWPTSSTTATTSANSTTCWTV